MLASGARPSEESLFRVGYIVFVGDASSTDNETNVIGDNSLIVLTQFNNQTRVVNSALNIFPRLFSEANWTLA